MRGLTVERQLAVVSKLQFCNFWNNGTGRYLLHFSTWFRHNRRSCQNSFSFLLWEELHKKVYPLLALLFKKNLKSTSWPAVFGPLQTCRSYNNITFISKVRQCILQGGNQAEITPVILDLYSIFVHGCFYKWPNGFYFLNINGMLACFGEM